VERAAVGQDAGVTDAPEDSPQLVVVGSTPGDQTNTEVVEQPAKVMRIGSMVKQLLDEVRAAPLDEKARSRLAEIYDTSVRELADGLSPDLRDELGRLSMPLSEGVPTEAELRVAQAQLVGWLEGLFHGIQATLFAQQVAAQNQLQQMRQRGLPPGGEGDTRPGTYL
jgi:proteasome activator-like protein